MNVIKLDDFRSHTTPLAAIIRVGNFNKQFERFHALGLLPDKRAVIDAYNVKQQSDLINELRAGGFQLVLDTKAAELACPFKWHGQARKAEWLDGEIERALNFSDFDDRMAASIAELAVAHNFHVVLAPSRYVSDTLAIKTLEQDHDFTQKIRLALDRAGGKSIQIASSFIGRHTLLGKEEITSRVIELNRNSPATVSWMRLSGVRRDPSPARIKKTARRMSLLREAGLPIVLDYAGGLEPLTLTALGAASGLCFGALANDQFSDQTWVKPSKSVDNSFGDSGRQQFARAPGLGRNFSHAELQLLSEAQKGKRLLFDPANTGIQSFEDFKTKAKESALREAVEAIGGLSDVPNSRRTDHIRTTHLDQNARKARQLSNLSLDTKRAEVLNVKSPQSLRNRLRDYASSLDKTGQALVKMSDEKFLRSVTPIALPHLSGAVRGSSSGEAQ